MRSSIGGDRLSETFAVLGNSTQRAILARLAQGEATVNEIAKPFDLTLPAVSKHIKMLAGSRVSGTGSPSPILAVRYRRHTAPGSLELDRAIPVHWESRFDRMNDYLTQLGRQQEAGKQDD